MKFNEPTPPFKPSRIQGPEDTGKRNFFRNVLRGAVAAGATFAGYKALKGTSEFLSEDPTKESVKLNIARLMAEMDSKKIHSVPMIETSAAEGGLSAAGRERLERILAAKGIKPSSPEDRMSFVRLQELFEEK